MTDLPSAGTTDRLNLPYRKRREVVVIGEVLRVFVQQTIDDLRIYNRALSEAEVQKNLAARF